MSLEPESTMSVTEIMSRMEGYFGEELMAQTF